MSSLALLLVVAFALWVCWAFGGWAAPCLLCVLLSGLFLCLPAASSPWLLLLAWNQRRLAESLAWLEAVVCRASLCKFSDLGGCGLPEDPGEVLFLLLSNSKGLWDALETEDLLEGWYSAPWLSRLKTLPLFCHCTLCLHRGFGPLAIRCCWQVTFKMQCKYTAICSKNMLFE